MRQASPIPTSSKDLAPGDIRRSGAVRRAEPATLALWSTGAMWAALAALAITIGACESPSSLAPGAPAPLQISTQGRLERGAAIQLQVTRNGSPVTDNDVTWTTTSDAIVRLVRPDTAMLTDTGTVSITAHMGSGTTTVTLRVAAPPTIVFAMHDVDASGNLGDYDIYRASLDGQQLTRLTSATADNDEPTVANGVVVFTSYRDGYPALYRVSLTGGAESRLPGLTGSAFQPALSVDGSHLAFIAPDSGDDKSLEVPPCRRTQVTLRMIALRAALRTRSAGSNRASCGAGRRCTS